MENKRPKPKVEITKKITTEIDKEGNVIKRVETPMGKDRFEQIKKERAKKLGLK